jgi:transposase-like protein
MRLTAQEKQEIINLVEGSDMGIHRCLQHLGIAKSTFFKWYKAYRDKGLVGLTPMPLGNRRQLDQENLFSQLFDNQYFIKYH